MANKGFPIGAPYPTIEETSGVNIDFGYAYFGVANGDPLTQPVDMYYDYATEQIAERPITILNGYFSRHGSATRLYATGDFSTLIKNRAGETVFYAKTSAEFELANSLVAQIIQNNGAFTAIASGGANAITAAFTPPISGLSTGLLLYVKSVLENTEATPTFTPNVDSISPRPIVLQQGLTLAVSQIPANYWMKLLYDEGLDSFVLLNPRTTFASTIVLPTTDIGPIYHAKYASWVRWRTFGGGLGGGPVYTGYCSDMLGSEISSGSLFNSIPGYLAQDGSSVGVSDYPALTAWAQNSGKLATSAADKAANKDKFFVDGPTLFLPDTRDYFERSYGGGASIIDPGRGFGTLQEDAIRNITGTFIAADDNSSGGATGVFSGAPAPGFNEEAGARTSSTVTFNASTVVPTAAENRVKNYVRIKLIHF